MIHRHIYQHALRDNCYDHSLSEALRRLETRNVLCGQDQSEIPDAHYIAANARILSVPLTGSESETRTKALLIDAVDSVGSSGDIQEGRTVVSETSTPLSNVFDGDMEATREMQKSIRQDKIAPKRKASNEAQTSIHPRMISENTCSSQESSDKHAFSLNLSPLQLYAINQGRYLNVMHPIIFTYLQSLNCMGRHHFVYDPFTSLQKRF
jgi:hypothetical protein